MADGKKAKKEKKEYEVKDKRRVNPDGSLKEDAEAPVEQQPAEPVAEEVEAPVEQQAQAPGPADEEAEAPGAGAEIPVPNVFETLQFVTGLLAEQAWQFMGLHLPVGRKEPIVDMAQAKVAIDTVIFIADKLHPHIDDEVRKAIRGIVSDLQLNFVQRNK